MKVLDLSLKHCWYDMIASGEKTEEYREIKPFYKKRLIKDIKDHCNTVFTEKGVRLECERVIFFKHYDAVRFHRGQGSPVTMLVECLKIGFGKGKPEWGAPKNEIVFIIKLGKRL